MSIIIDNLSKVTLENNQESNFSQKCDYKLNFKIAFEILIIIKNQKNQVLFE